VPGRSRARVRVAGANGPGDKVLAARLKYFEAPGLIVRTVDPGPPVRVSCELTPAGRGFHQVAVAIDRWGHEFVPGYAARAQAHLRETITDSMEPEDDAGSGLQELR
jgi:hypothetical protein